MTEEELAKADEWKKRVSFKDKDYWVTHQRLKLDLLKFVRANIRTQRLRNGAKPAEIRETDQMLDPKALTIGFARRFATYKGRLFYSETWRSWPKSSTIRSDLFSFFSRARLIQRTRAGKSSSSRSYRFPLYRSSKIELFLLRTTTSTWLATCTTVATCG